MSIDALNTAEFSTRVDIHRLHAVYGLAGLRRRLLLEASNHFFGILSFQMSNTSGFSVGKEDAEWVRKLRGAYDEFAKAYEASSATSWDHCVRVFYSGLSTYAKALTSVIDHWVFWEKGILSYKISTTGLYIIFETAEMLLKGASFSLIRRFAWSYLDAYVVMVSRETNIRAMCRIAGDKYQYPGHWYMREFSLLSGKYDKDGKLLEPLV